MLTIGTEDHHDRWLVLFKVLPGERAAVGHFGEFERRQDGEAEVKRRGAVCLAETSKRGKDKNEEQ